MANGGKRDVELRIRTQSDAKKEFEALVAAVDKLTKSFDEFGKDAGTANKSVEELTGELKQLDEIGKRLRATGGINKYFDDLEKGVVDSKLKIVELEKEMLRLKKRNEEFASFGTLTDKQIGQYERLRKSLVNANNLYEQQVANLRELQALGGREVVAAAPQLVTQTERTAELISKEIDLREKNRLAIQAEVMARDEAAKRAAQSQAEFNRLLGVEVTQRMPDGDDRRKRELEYAEQFDRIEKQRVAQAQESARRIADARKREEQAEIESAKRRFQIYDAMLAREKELEKQVIATAQNVKRARVEAASAGTAVGRTAGFDQLFTVDRNGARQTLDFFQRLRGQILALAAAYTGIYGAINQFNQALREQAQIKGVEARLAISLDTEDAQRIGKELQFIRDTADRLGVQFLSLAESFSRFQVSAKLGGLSLEETRTIFVNFTEAARASRLSADDVAGVFRALEQIASKGRFQLEELSGQLGDRLPGALAILAKALNISQIELRELVAEGNVSATALTAFSDAAQEAFAKGLPQAVESLDAELNRASNLIVDLRSLVADEMSPELTEALRDLRAVVATPEFKEGLRALIDIFDNLFRILPFVAENIGTIAVALGAMVSTKIVGNLMQLSVAVGRAGTGFKLWAAGAASAATATTTLSKAARVLQLSMGWIGVVVVAISAVVDLIGDWSNATEDLEDKVNNLRAAEERRNNELERQRKADEAAAKRNVIARQYTEARDAAQKLISDRSEQIGLTDVQRKLVEIDKKYEEVIKQLQTASKARTENAADIVRGQIDEQRKLIEEAYAKGEKFAVKGIDPRRQQRKVQAETEKQQKEDERALAELQSKEREDALRESRRRQDEEMRRAVEAEIEAEGRKHDELKKFEEGLRKENATTFQQKLALIEDEYQKQLQLIEVYATEIGLTDERKTQLQELAEANKNLAEAELQRKDAQDRLKEQAEAQAVAEEKLNGLLELRAVLIEAIESDTTLTESQRAEQIAEVYRKMKDEIVEAAIAARDFYNAQGDKTAVVRMDLLINKTKDLTKEYVIANLTAQEIEEQIASGLVNAIEDFASGVSSAQDAMRNFFSELLAYLAKAILQEQILALVKSFNLFHSGGVVGDSSSGVRSREVSPLAFVGAPRYHSGGFAGMAPNEVPAILERGEEVLTADDPRHIANGGGMQQASVPQQPMSVQVVNTIDTDSVFQAGATSSTFKRVVLNVIKANSASIKQVLG